MEIIPTTLIKDKTSKPECELVEQEKEEYKLIGKFRRTKGLKLFAYDPKENYIYETDIRLNNSISLVADEKGSLTTNDDGTEEVTVNSSHTHFEALNMKTAEKRLAKFKKGLIDDLCNLKRFNPDGIKFY